MSKCVKSCLSSVHFGVSSVKRCATMNYKETPGVETELHRGGTLLRNKYYPSTHLPHWTDRPSFINYLAELYSVTIPFQ